jgi:hypothetical protein
METKTTGKSKVSPQRALRVSLKLILLVELMLLLMLMLIQQQEQPALRRLCQKATSVRIISHFL